MRSRSYLVNFKNREKNKGIKDNPTHFIFFDTETKQEDTIKKIGKKFYRTIVNTLDFGYACYYNSETDKQEWYKIESIENFSIWLRQVISKCREKTLWIIAHNIVFDNFITNMWNLLSDYETEFIHSKGMVFIQSLKKKDANGKTRHKILLLNNGNIFPAPLKVIGETIGVHKIDFDFNRKDLYTREEFERYGKGDVLILVEFWKTWIKFINENEIGKVKYTISSQSLEAFKQKFCEHYIILDDNMDNLAFERKAYYGGRTEIFYKGKVCRPIKYYDVNSMYPHVMKNYRYPTEYKFSKENISIDQLKYYLERGWLCVAELTLSTMNNCYPSKINGSLVFPIGEFKTFLCTPEVEEAIKNNDIKQVHKVSFYKGEKIFSDYIDFFYNKRQELKKEGNPQERMFKLFLNSLYGKFGQMTDNWTETTIEEIKNIDPNFDFDDWVMDNYKIPKIVIGGIDVTPKIRFIGNQLQITCEKEESDLSFPAIAGHVTSYARLIIWEGLKWARDNKVNIFYCDTDSLFSDGDLPPELVDKHQLGKFKVEKEYPNGVEFMNLKNYCGLDENGNIIIEDMDGNMLSFEGENLPKDGKFKKGKSWVMKGVRQDADIIDENTFIAQEWGGLPKQEYYKRFGRKDGEFWVIYKEKKIKGDIRKGILTKSGKIQPFTLKLD